jgi:hypothetical protein
MDLNRQAGSSPMRLALLSLVLALLPAAQAGLAVGQLHLEKDDPIAPGSEGTLVAPLSFSCGAAEAWNPTDASHKLTAKATSLPAGYTVADASADIPASACAGPASQAWTQDLKLTVKVAPDAVGLRPETLTFTFDIGAYGNAPASSAKGNAQVTAGFVGKVEAALQDPTAATDHAQAHFSLRLRNLSNAMAVVTVLAPDPAPAGLTFTMPGDSTLNRGDATSVPILVTVTGAAAASTPVAFRVLVAASTDRSMHGPETTVAGTVGIGADGTAPPKSSPAPSLLFAVAALGLAAVARRRLD